jgi:hypothetical protein
MHDLDVRVVTSRFREFGFDLIPVANKDEAEV